MCDAILKVGDEAEVLLPPPPQLRWRLHGASRPSDRFNLIARRELLQHFGHQLAAVFMQPNPRVEVLGGVSAIACLATRNLVR